VALWKFQAVYMVDDDVNNDNNDAVS